MKWPERRSSSTPCATEPEIRLIWRDASDCRHQGAWACPYFAYDQRAVAHRPWAKIIETRRPRCREEEHDVGKDLQRTCRVGEPGIRRQREVPGPVQALDRGPERVLGRGGQAHRL